MNEACRLQVARLLERLPEPKRIIEFGSRDVNGNVRDLLPKGAEYIGVDSLPGPNVDVVADAAGYEPPWHPDLVLCLNTLEHAPLAPIIIGNAWRILAAGGSLLLSWPDTTWPPHSAIDGGPLRDGEHSHNVTPEELAALLQQFQSVTMYTAGQLIYALATKAADVVALRRLNVGSGDFPLPGWANLDSSPERNAEIVADAIEYLRGCEGGRWDEIYAGHFLEHLEREEALEFLRECWRVLAPGGRLGIVVPDTREVARRYVAGSVDSIEWPHDVWRPIADLDTLNEMFFYSTVQESRHKWSYDAKTLQRAMTEAGFIGLREIDRYRDPRLGSGRWYQCGLDGWKPKERK
jgi:predicted SAM-dependent methyltransferase